ncbi:hypothetical protein [Agaribacterium haliotis]|uniref:hypothetical protein n=1 Tax=Agaribacterium haliotis TaxID=2013869 RepID=UPI0011782A63|nr:hypothetical protein [Agaribacterium haliotis]
MRVQFSYRGDTRDLATMRSTGGFVPKYLLEHHAGGFDGFLACNNKTNGKLGCNCAGMNEDALFQRARLKLKAMLLDPMQFQQHVMFNNVGLLSTASAEDDAYGGHQYQIIGEWHVEGRLAEASEKLGERVGRLNAFSRNYRLVCNANRLQNATMFGVVPHQAVEVSFVSPVRFRNLMYRGFK